MRTEGSEPGRPGQGDERANDDGGVLRAAFAELCAQDGARAPDVEAMLRGAFTRRAVPWRFRHVAIPLAAAAALAVLVLARAPDATDTRFREAVIAWSSDPALGAWRSPTDFLLAVPGQELLRTTPRVSLMAMPAAADLRPGPDHDTTKGGAP